MLSEKSDIENNYLFHLTIAEFYKEENKKEKAIDSYKKAMSLTKNKRDSQLLKKKLIEVVPIS